MEKSKKLPKPKKVSKPFDCFMKNKFQEIVKLNDLHPFNDAQKVISLLKSKWKTMSDE